MDDSMIYLGLGIITMLLMVVGVLVARRYGKLGNRDYRVIFVLGISLLPLGIVFDNPIFSLLGIVYMIWALVNRDKWGKPHKESYSDSQAI
ncbi:MAG: hypothetical protein ACE5I5_09580 [Candidatus Heimdallarchaeota archaeon]